MVAAMATWSVDLGDSIQAAIDAASDGDRIEIAAGSFAEEIDVGGRSLTLVGAGASSTTIGDTHLGTCLTASGGDLVLEGLAIAGCDTLVNGQGGTWSFTDVDLWGSDDPGRVDGVSWTWDGGGLSLVYGPLVASDSVLEWTNLVVTDVTTETSVFTLTDTDVTLDVVEIADLSFPGNSWGAFRMDGGSLVGTALDIHDFDVTGGVSTVIYTEDADVTLTDSTLADIPLGAIDVDGTLTTERCAFSEVLGSYFLPTVGAETWVSTDDVFTVSTTGGEAGWSRAGTLTGTLITGYDPADTVLVFAGPFALSGATIDGGTVRAEGTSGTVDGSAFTGETALNAYFSDMVVTDSTFTGSGGPALLSTGANFVGEDLTFSGYDDIAETCVSLSLTRVSVTGGGLASLADCDVTLTDVTLDTSSYGLSTERGDIALTGVDIVTAGYGLAFASEAVLSDVTIDADDVGILFDHGDISGAGVDVNAGEDGIAVRSDQGRVASITLDDLTIDAGDDGISVDGHVELELTLTDSAITAVGAGFRRQIEGVATFDTVSIDAADGISSVYANLEATDVTVTATGTGVDEASVIWDGGSVTAGGDGFTGNQLEASGVDVDAGGTAVSVRSLWLDDSTLDGDAGCVVTDSYTDLSGVDCRAGAAPLTLSGSTVALSDVAVTDSVGGSRIEGVDLTLADLRFVRVSADVAPLQILDSTVVATGLNFQSNVGTDAGALVVEGSSGSVTGAVFHDNAATDGPGAVLDASGLDWDCSAFVANTGVAGDLELDERAVLDHVTLAGSTATTGALAVVAPYFSLSSSIVTAGSAAGVYGDADVRTAFVTWTDVWGNAGDEWGGGIEDPTGTNGNISADPLLDAALDPG